MYRGVSRRRRFGLSLQSPAVMRRRGRRPVPPELRSAREAFRSAERRIEEATAVLLLGVPSGRAARLPLAEALAGFESALREAMDAMGSWHRPEVAEQWEACRRALDVSTGRAERLRTEAAPGSYEELAPILADVLRPLEAFGAAAARFHELRA